MTDFVVRNISLTVLENVGNVGRMMAEGRREVFHVLIQFICQF
jgi:hypothetical protein